MPLRNELIRQYREELGLTQAQAAAAARVGGRQNWHRIETDKKSINAETLIRIANLLKRRPEELVELD